MPKVEPGTGDTRTNQKVVLPESFDGTPALPDGAQDAHIPKAVVTHTEVQNGFTAKQYRDKGYAIRRKADGSEYGDDELYFDSISDNEYAEPGTVTLHDGTVYQSRPVASQDGVLPAEIAPPSTSASLDATNAAVTGEPPVQHDGGTPVEPGPVIESHPEASPEATPVGVPSDSGVALETAPVAEKQG